MRSFSPSSRRPISTNWSARSPTTRTPSGWLRDGAALGGFHLFTTRAAADASRDGTLVAGLTANPAFSEFLIQHYGVLEGLSRITANLQPVAA